MKTTKNFSNILWIILLGGILFTACQKEKIVFETYDHRAFLLDTMAGKKGTVYIFLAPECPLSENYTLTINQLQAQFVDSGLQFYAVISGQLYDSVAIRDYAKRFPLTLPLLVDTGYYFSTQFKANTTPEVVLFNAQNEKVYQGVIDDWATELTQLKASATHYYLMDAMNSVLKNEKIKISKTNAVGCFIER
jgi:thiol-disulfide isomerase/thioredoxin